MRLPGSEHGRVAVRVVAILILLLCPWPGLAGSFTTASASVCNALSAIDWSGDSSIRFEPSRYTPEHPWWMSMTIRNVFTGQSLEMPVDTRSLGYVRLAVFGALALAWPVWRTRRLAQAGACGFALLLGVMALSLLMPVLQVLGMVKVLPFGVTTQSILSIGILTLVTCPSMAFAVPALIWALVAWSELRKNAWATKEQLRRQ